MTLTISHDSVRTIITLGATLLLAAGCATVPEPLAGDFTDLYPEQAGEKSIGTVVRWGGTIVDARPGREETCIEVLARELDHQSRPVDEDRAKGRFLACRDGLQDPVVFASGRDLTVVGRLAGFVDGRIGEFEYTYPRIDADTLFLWAEQPDFVYYADPWLYDPWWHYGRYPRFFPRSRFHGHLIIRP